MSIEAVSMPLNCCARWNICMVSMLSIGTYFETNYQTILSTPSIAI